MAVTFTPDNSPDILEKTLRELKDEIPDDTAIQVFNRVNETTGETYTIVHGRGDGARVLQRMLLAFGVVTLGDVPQMVKGDQA